MELLLYITWFVALCTTFINFFFDNKRTILWIQCITLLFYGTHVLLLGWVATAWFLYMQIWRNIFFALNFNRRIQTFWLLMLLGIYIYIYFENRILDPLAHFTLLWTILGTLWCWVQQTKIVRILFFISTLPWLYYVLQINSSFAIVLQFVFTFSILINIVRFDILKKK